MVDIINNNNLLNRVMNLGEPFSITATGASATAAAGQTFTVPMAAGYLYKIKGMEVTVTGNQLFEGAWITSALAEVATTPAFVPAKTIRGASVHLSKNKRYRRRQFAVSFSFAAAGGGAGINIMDDFEFPVGVTLRRAYWNAGTGTGAVAFKVQITVGAAAAVIILNNLGANAVQLENENINLNIPANTDCLVEFNDAGVATADQNLVLWFEVNDEQIDYEAQEFIPISFFRGTTASGLTVNLMDDFEVPENMVIRRAYAQVAVAPGGGFTVDFFVNGANLGCQIAAAAVIAENEGLSIPLPADVDQLFTIIDSGGASTDYMLTIWCQRTTPITQSEMPTDIEDVYGECFVGQNDSLTIRYDQGVAAETITAVVYGTRYRLRN